MAPAHANRMTVPATSDQTEVGNYFVANYPPFSVWNREAVETEARPALWPRVAASCEFRKPLRFEDEFDVHLRVEAKTPKTLRYAAVLRKGRDVIAEGSLTVICVQRRPGESIAAIDMPADISGRFAVAPDDAVGAGPAHGR